MERAGAAVPWAPSLPRWRAGAPRREPRVVVRDAAGRSATLAPDDPAGRRLVAAAERLVSAVQRGSDV